MKAGGIVLIVVAVLFLGATLFFGYFSWANFGSAARLAISLPEGADFVVSMVRAKAERQMMIAGGSFVGFLLFLIPGAILFLKGRKKAPAQIPQGVNGAPMGY